MKKLYFLLFTVFLSAMSFGQTVVFQENFEGAASFTTSMPQQTDMSFDYFTVTDGSDVGGVYNSPEGSNFFAAHDLDADGMMSPATMTFDDLNISGFTNLTLAILLAEDDDGSNEDWDNSDFLHIEYDIDNSGTFTNLLWVENDGTTFNAAPRIDSDFDGNGEGAEITDIFTEFAAAIAGTGNVIDIRITFGGLTSSDEDIAIDDIRIVDGYVTPSTITITSPTAGTEFAPGTSSVDLTWTTTGGSGGETVNVTVNGNVTPNAPNPFSIATTDGETYMVSVEFVDGMTLLDSDMTDFSVQTINAAASIAELRMGNPGDFYVLNGEGILTFQQDSRNQKFIEDAPGMASSAGIVIDDSAGTITTTYNIGDGITGIVGQLSDFGGTLQFVPSADPGAASSTGNAVTPQAVSVLDLSMNAENYESELVIVSAVTMDNTTATFASGSTHTITSGMDQFEFRSSFPAADYVVQTGTVPTDPTDITGIISERFGPYYITARDTNDFSVMIVLSNEDFNANSFSLYPNPTSEGYVNISTVSNDDINVAVFDILGKQVKNETLRNERLDVSNLKSGVYLLRLTQNEATVTKKLVIN